jgi:hypothetical protein
MNVHTDHLATDYLNNYADPSKIAPFIPASIASLTINGETITRRYATRLRQAASSQPSFTICTRIAARNHSGISIQFDPSMHWDVPVKALDTLGNSAQIFIIKFAHDHLPTHRHMQRMNRPGRVTDKCPACQHIVVVETDWHILSCPKRPLSCETLLTTLMR